MTTPTTKHMREAKPVYVGDQLLQSIFCFLANSDNAFSASPGSPDLRPRSYDRSHDPQPHERT